MMKLSHNSSYTNVEIFNTTKIYKAEFEVVGILNSFEL